MAEKGQLSINSENMFPIIKKWLYSDHDIFYRELISNGCDAITKLKKLEMMGETELPEGWKARIDVVLDPEEKTIQICDNGLGMTADEVKEYINNIAFSGAEAFMNKYKDKANNDQIIGHFGLGFYSAFMVSELVTIDTLSYQKDAKAVHWECDGGSEFTMEDSDRKEVGTTITLHLSEDCVEFANYYRAREVIEKYCGYMPTEIYLSVKNTKETETIKESERRPDDVVIEVIEPKKEEKKEDDKKDEASAEPAKEEAPAEKQLKIRKRPELVNDPNPLWTKNPKDCTEEEYKEFYRRLFNDYKEPLFWIHLNMDYPFNLKGILYFPKINLEYESAEGVIKLYNNQVFIADNIKEVIPEFLMLLKGVIDCPDLPLNVSRSFLQNDGYVRKMSDYITRKVADRLMSEFNTKREDYQKYWKDIHPFVKYGCIRDEKFFSRVKEAIIYRTTAGEFLTAKEYKQRNCEGDETLMYYTSDEKRQAQMIEMFTSQGKDVVVMDTLIDNHFMSFLEYAAKEDQVKFRRVDAGLDGLTEEGETDAEAEKKLQELFREATGEKELDVKLATLKSDEMPAMITVEEQSRRFTEMSREWGGGMQMPEKRTLTLNRKHPLIAYLEREDGDADMRKTVCEQVVDLAEMARQPLTAERMVAFLKRSTKILGLAVKE